MASDAPPLGIKVGFVINKTRPIRCWRDDILDCQNFQGKVSELDLKENHDDG